MFVFSKQEWLLKLQQLTEELSTIDWIQFKITNPVSCFFPLLYDRRLNIFGLLTEHDIWGCQLGLCDTLIKSFREKTTHWLSSDYTVCLLVSALVSIIKHETGILIRAENMTWNELIAYDRSFGGNSSVLIWVKSHWHTLQTTFMKKQEAFSHNRVLLIGRYFQNKLINHHIEHKMSKLRSKICFIWESKVNKKNI